MRNLKIELLYCMNLSSTHPLAFASTHHKVLQRFLGIDIDPISDIKVFDLYCVAHVRSAPQILALEK